MKGKKMKRVEILGLISGICTTAAFIPQIFTVWSMRPEPATSISLPMYLLFIIGVIGWTLYGVKPRSISIKIVNSATTVLAFTILVYKFLYG
jgi:MtN3 and saliva related transmembrane protein